MIAPKFLRPSHLLGGLDDGRHSVVDFKQAKEQRELGRRMLDPKQQALVKEFLEDHPEWGPQELEKLHDELECW